MAGVYIAYPFCEQKCSFCNFASDVPRPGERELYGAALLREIRGHHWNWQPQTLYFGGGTPTLMPRELLAEIFATIPSGCLSEITIECAPGTITTEAVRMWRSFGINRVSMGVQSFLPNELRLTGRRHTSATIARDIAILRREGIDNINLDLIAGLPEQTCESWERSLHQIEVLNPPHVSIYIFEADEDSRLGKELTLGGVRYGAGSMPTDDQIAGFYERAAERLALMGIPRYEISNFARPGFESRHNLKYWKLEPYIGFGLDAHSFDGRLRWGNPETVSDYMAHRSIDPVASDLGEEHFFVGLRLTEGIEPTPEEGIRFARPISKWLQRGMLEREGSRLRLSGAGILLSNEVFQEFLDVH